MNKKDTNKDTRQSGTKSKLAVAGLIGSAVAGTVYLYGPDGNKRRQRIRGWMLKAKGEILDHLAAAETLTKQTYEDIVDRVMNAYADESHVKEKDVARLKKELKNNWEDIVSAIEAHMQHVQADRDVLLDSIATGAIAEAARDIAQEADIDERQDIKDILQSIASSGVSVARRIKDVLTNKLSNDTKEASQEIDGKSDGETDDKHSH